MYSIIELVRVFTPSYHYMKKKRIKISMSLDLIFYLRRQLPDSFGSTPPEIASDWTKWTLKNLDVNLPKRAPTDSLTNEEDLRKLAAVGLTVVRTLGSGSFSVVCECKVCLAGQISCHLAVKRISIFNKLNWDKNSFLPKVVEAVEKEAAITNVLMINPHSNIVTVVQVMRFFYGHEKRFPFPYNYLILTELLHGNLEDFILKYCGETTSLRTIRGLPEVDTKILVLQIAKALDFLHNSPKRVEVGQDPASITITHGDIKPENILYKIKANHRVRFKLGDFGLCTMFEERQKVITNLIMGTEGYAPPEAMSSVTWTSGDGWDPKLGDVYSLGATAFASFIGFGGSDRLEFIYKALDNLCQKGIHFIEISSMRNQFRMFLAKTCARNPTDRYSLADLFSDSWLFGVDEEGQMESLLQYERRQQFGCCRTQ